MGTYLISDLHGAYDRFIKLLDMIKPDLENGEDELYLLGDYGDWGKRSIETFRYVMELDKSPYVHCIKGNHDLMFEEQIRDRDYLDVNWYYSNMGMKTWDEYLKLDSSIQKEIADWIKGLKYSLELKAGGELYMVAHAYPYFGNRGNLGYLYTTHDAVWMRLSWDSDPFRDYHGKKKYRALICGHTITGRYYRESGLKKTYEHNCIFKGPHFIGIDCGAKCLEYSHLWPKEAEDACIGALRLEDMKEFYA
ncbi:MAG: metallophosphoesterase [Lachnospiraceae bacterium]|nr:metallophosphoesterase [Lachnospiraceae bacterium]